MFSILVTRMVFGVVPLQIFLLTHEPRYLELGRGLADKQWENPTPDGITREARYWVDDMYMITAVQVQAFRATSQTQYLDRAALTVAHQLRGLEGFRAKVETDEPCHAASRPDCPGMRIRSDRRCPRCRGP